MPVPKKKHTRSRSNKRKNHAIKQRSEKMVKRAITALNKEKRK